MCSQSRYPLLPLAYVLFAYYFAQDSIAHVRVYACLPDWTDHVRQILNKHVQQRLNVSHDHMHFSLGILHEKSGY